jgi:hypothetical protein
LRSLFTIDFKVNRADEKLIESGIDEDSQIYSAVEEVLDLTTRVLGRNRIISEPKRAFRHAGKKQIK